MRNDIDPTETKEWLDAMESVLSREGEERAAFLLDRLVKHAADKGVQSPYSITTPYRNTIPTEKEALIPGDIFIERRIRSVIRWNAVAMVQRANKLDSSLGGHLSTFASSATLYDVGYNYFFHGPQADNEGDLIYYQGHASPGIYARAFVEGRLSEEHIDFFRREVDQVGVSSYPHPWLMPDFWQFPTVSMGLGPLMAIYQAYFMRYLINRGIMPEQQRKVWAFLGDGETDEPESLGAISLAGREKLDNLIFVINCNLQRLDGPVRGNGKIIQELEGVFRGAGWNVIKVVWGGKWDRLLQRDKEGLLQKIMDEAVDGVYQNCKNKGGKWTRENFFGKDTQVLKMVEDLSDDDIWHLNRGGHDPQKVYAAYHAAVNHKGQPTVILAKTVKGYGLGASAEASNIAHNVKKLPVEDLQHFCKKFGITPDTDGKSLEDLPFLRPKEDSQEMIYLKQRREKLGGFVPRRREKTSLELKVPKLEAYQAVLKGSGDREISTTMAFNRTLDVLIKDKQMGQYIVPIVPDEARTFGMEGLFRRIGIYASEGQKYEPQDVDQLAYYKESSSGQILQVGINEAGAHAAWIAAATSYSSNNIPMIPFYIFYSMFGFQRTGDLAWLGGDIRARGFLIGAVSGRTTLNGEGLQHEDGHSHVLAGTIPNCISYDPAYGYEIAVIVQDGMRRMVEDQEDIFYYLTIMNEAYQQPAMPERKNLAKEIVQGLYCLETGKPAKKKHRVQLMGSGTILNEVRAAATILRDDFDIEADIWSATSFNELRREALEVSRQNRLNPDKPAKKSFVEKQLEGHEGPVIAASDYMKIYADQLREFIPGTFIALGTDGFGRSDTREKLRHFFEVDRYFITVTALYALVKENKITASVVSKAMQRFGISKDKISAMHC